MEKTTYALLIYRTAPAEPAPEDSARALVGHRALQKDAEAKGDLHAVAKLAGVETARTVRRCGGAHDVTDGPYIDTKEWLVGFYVVDCVDDAEALARGFCTSSSRPFTPTSTATRALRYASIKA